MLVSKGKVNRSLDLCLIAKERTGDCEQGFVFKHVYTVYSLFCVPLDVSLCGNCKKECLTTVKQVFFSLSPKGSLVDIWAY